MRHSSPPTDVLLPFGALMGLIPIDSVSRARALRDFGTLLAGSGQRMSEIQQQLHSVIDPAAPAPRRRVPAE
jgi:hypothetical protein